MAQKKTRRVIRVLTEGEITEPQYLTAWARRNRSHVRLEISDRGVTPKTLVDRARGHVRRNRPTKRRTPDYDEIWCVFDTDEHPNLPQAVEEARQGGIEVAVSNPCFELWLVLHAHAQTAHIDRHRAQQRSAELGLSHDKAIPQDAQNTLIDTFETAKQRAIDLSERHAGNGSPPRTNPSTDVWRLVDRLRNTK
ncbi:MAG: RloB domain-containing protein [Acidobacteria bacterium]|nr:RloB domain-containing protein [Acidobacteriota bacterium]